MQYNAKLSKTVIPHSGMKLSMFRFKKKENYISLLKEKG